MTNFTPESRLSAVPTFAVVVRRELANGGSRTSIFRTIAPAERSLERARKAGLNASVSFVQLVPVEQPSADVFAAVEGGEQ